MTREEAIKNMYANTRGWFGLLVEEQDVCEEAFKDGALLIVDDLSAWSHVSCHPATHPLNSIFEIAADWPKKMPELEVGKLYLATNGDKVHVGTFNKITIDGHIEFHTPHHPGWAIILPDWTISEIVTKPIE